MKQKIDKCRRQEHLDLHQQSMTDDEFEYLSSKSWRNNIKSLKLNGNKISWVGISSFCREDWSNLTKIQLSNNKIRDKGCKYLSKANMRLTQISLNFCEIGSSGILHLMKSKWNLQLLSLFNNMSIGQDFRTLMKMANNNLKKIGVKCVHFGYIAYILLFEGKLSGFWFIEHIEGYKLNCRYKENFKELLAKRFEIDHLSIG